MDQNEQQYIDRLFERLVDAERQSGPRDASAERYIQQLVARQPGAPYYMAQSLIVHEEALKGAQQRIEDLERELEEQRPAQQSGGGGFLGGLFGGGSNPTRPTSVPPTGSAQRTGGFNYPRDDRGYDRAPMDDPRYGQQQPPMGYGQPQQQPARGGGFLAGAAQTAAGVAGGVLLGNMLGGMFGGEKSGTAHAGEAAKAEPAPAAQPEEPKAPDQSQDDPFANVQNTQYDEDDDVFSGDFGGEDI